MPFASKAVKNIVPAAKKIAGSKIVRETGKQLLDSGVDAMANVAANAISGEKSVGDSMSEELTNARKEISTALKKANRERKLPDEKVSGSSKKKKKKGKRKISKKSRKQSVFDDDD